MFCFTIMQPCSDASRHLLDQAMIAGVDRSAGRPSDIGPAAECSHGGPDVRKGKTGLFLPAMIGFLGSYFQIKNQLVSEQRQAELAHAELDLFFKYWSRPEMAATISRHSYRVAFACAVDATLDSEFVVARCFLRIAFLVRMWAKLGGAAVMSSITTSASVTPPGLEWQDLIRCLNETKTDRGTVLYLAQQVPCGCLSVLVSTLEQDPRTRKCLACEAQRPSWQMKKCSGCRVAAYCNPECQYAHWKDHKFLCKLVRTS